MIYQYAKSQSTLHSVIEILATFPGDMRTRLNDSFSELDSITDNNLPEELRDDWGFIRRQLTACGPKYDCYGKVCMGSVQHTMSKIRNSTASKIAEKIFRLYYELNFNDRYTNSAL